MSSSSSSQDSTYDTARTSGSSHPTLSAPAPSGRPSSPPPLGYLDDLHPTSLLTHLHHHALSSRPHRPSPSPRRRRSLDSNPTSPDAASPASGSSQSWSDDDTDDSDEDRRLAQLEWDEGLDQLQRTVQLVLFPFVGKWLGRQWGYWAFARYRRFGGLTARFFSVDWMLKPATNFTSVPSSG